MDEAINFLKTQMGKDVNRTSRENIPINLKKEEMSKYVKRFNAIDREKKGYITVTDMTRSMKVKVPETWKVLLVFNFILRRTNVTIYLRTLANKTF